MMRSVKEAKKILGEFFSYDPYEEFKKYITKDEYIKILTTPGWTLFKKSFRREGKLDYWGVSTYILMVLGVLVNIISPTRLGVILGMVIVGLYFMTVHSERRHLLYDTVLNNIHEEIALLKSRFNFKENHA